MKSHERGRLGERLAVDFLEREGWRILARNWRAGHGELDLVVRRDDVIAFVEVKTRSGREAGDPLEAITRGKRREVEKVARAWIFAQPSTAHRAALYRFDAVSVVLDEGGRTHVRHVADAWRIGER